MLMMVRNYSDKPAEVLFASASQAATSLGNITLDPPFAFRAALMLRSTEAFLTDFGPY